MIWGVYIKFIAEEVQIYTLFKRVGSLVSVSTELYLVFSSAAYL